MKEIYFGDSLILDLSKLVLSNTIKGIEYVNEDPLDKDDSVIYLFENSNKLYLRYNTALFEIGTRN